MPKDSAMGIDLINEDPQAKNKQRKTRILIACILIAIVLIIIIAVVLVFVLKDKQELSAKVETLEFTLPTNGGIESATYLYSGRILVHYHINGTSENYLAVMDDDGKNWQEIWHGSGIHYKANGFRIMPFTDNKRILLGDYILECSPSIDNCTKSEAILVVYPELIVNDPRVFLVWSECIISQDGNYIAWSTLGTPFGSINFLGKITRGENNYTFSNVKIISNSEFFKVEGEQLVPIVIRGGEIKQFCKGGTGVTVAGSTNTGIAKSIFQDLASERVTPLSHEIGYDETTILSPDENLGITMSTRNSPNTNFAILGLVPVPNDVIVTSTMNRYVYTFAITNVRNGKHRGNVGPVLTKIMHSIEDENYHGIALHDPSNNWTFCSPISWHPSSTKALWLEIGNCGETKGIRRIRKAQIIGHTAQEPVATKPTPENISYALDLQEFTNMSNMTFSGKVIGKNSGSIYIQRNATYAYANYDNYSDDGNVFYNGEMYFTQTSDYGGKLVSKVNGTKTDGSTESVMDFRLTFSSGSDLLFDADVDGKPKSYGYATYKDRTINVDTYKD
ncbi:hypothetical protein GPJ56_004680 [Histomonas meleagridis]|uniref:Uncharacterized protein n=1 Tax=Histomonas meleagridis TaxID=135588 RepID=UPI003559E286|nr:hypothetical protein GPJ56_004680 [Histomonas meleagridis]KAH0797441.1 Uncharacterized protein GO595_009762 [Histomonas meleagridis]